jgi:hypothetical protein
MRNGHRKLWTPEEDNQLRELIAAGASVTSICAKLTRSPEAIRMRAVLLQKGATSSSNLLTPTPELPDNTLLALSPSRPEFGTRWPLQVSQPLARYARCGMHSLPFQISVRVAWRS